MHFSLFHKEARQTEPSTPNKELEKLAQAVLEVIFAWNHERMTVFAVSPGAIKAPEHVERTLGLDRCETAAKAEWYMVDTNTLYVTSEDGFRLLICHRTVVCEVKSAVLTRSVFA